tara:strand:- start:1205 stop:1408 length:204 start_codon:yes stop_codon:yes gene_type:complete
MSIESGETRRWGYYRVGDNKLITTYIAKTLCEAEYYFNDYFDDYLDDGLLETDPMYEVRIINQNKDE